MNDCNRVSWAGRVFRFYRDGFREMTVGRVLWGIILLKLFIMFAILKVFFFRDPMRDCKDAAERSGRVMERLVDPVADDDDITDLKL